MLNSTLKRTGLLLSSGLMIVLLGYTLYPIASDEAHSAKTIDNAQAESAPETLLAKDEKNEMPIVKLASLSVVTELPNDNDLSYIPESDMTIEERLMRARQLANEQEFENALRLLDVSAQNENETYSINYLKAQLLSWSGNHDKAQSAFKELRAQYPQDADIAVSFGYLRLYQSEYKEAERLFSQVLERFPDYQDAQLGLNRALAIE